MRTTISTDTDIHQLLKVYALENKTSVYKIVDEAFLAFLISKNIDISEIKKRLKKGVKHYVK